MSRLEDKMALLPIRDYWEIWMKHFGATFLQIRKFPNPGEFSEVIKQEALCSTIVRFTSDYITLVGED
jgi:hypothetical protein